MVAVVAAVFVGFVVAVASVVVAVASVDVAVAAVFAVALEFSAIPITGLSALATAAFAP